MSRKSSILIAISWKNPFILTAQFFDFFACFLHEEFFVIKFQRTSFLNEEMQSLRYNGKNPEKKEFQNSNIGGGKRLKNENMCQCQFYKLSSTVQQHVTNK